MTAPTAVRIDGGEPVLEQHQLAVVPRAYDTVIWCSGCGEHLRLKYAELPKHEGTPCITVGDLIWLATEHRGQLAAEPECNGICTTGWDLGLAEYGDTIAHAHPDCSLHGGEPR